MPNFAVREQQGFVWVWAQPDDAPVREPFCFPYLDDPDYHSFRVDYRANGTLHATLENMLDVPHTAFLHRGLFRGGAKQRISAVVRRGSERVEAEYIGERPPKGIAARVLGLGQGTEATMAHFDRFILPSISQVEYRLGPRSHLVASAALTPVSDFETTFSTVITYRLPVPAWATRLLFRPLVKRIFAQDAAIVASQAERVRTLGGENYSSTPADLLGAEIWSLMREAEAADNGNGASGSAGPDGHAPASNEREHRIELLV